MVCGNLNNISDVSGMDDASRKLASVYSAGKFFAVIDNDTLCFKVDDVLARRYREKGMPPFAPGPGAKPMMGYYQVPPDVLETRTSW